MTKPHRYLTKSRFKTAKECPTKLYFTGKPEYGNNNLDNAFLKALADGGFQVGELAKLYHPNGVEISTLDIESAITQTNDLLKQETVTIYEPAIRFENLLVRVDILIKNGDSIELIEVKSKSIDPTEEDIFYDKRELKKNKKKINSKWEPYLLDIAFQTYVVRKAFPKWKVTSALRLVDKTSKTSVDGLNQLFFLETDEKGRHRAITRPGTQPEDVGTQILAKISVDDEVKLLLSQDVEDKSFSEYVSYLSGAYSKDTMILPKIGPECKGCEFRIPSSEKAKGLKSGFEVCWAQAAKLKPKDFEKPLVFDIWNFRKSEKLVAEGTYFMDELEEADIDPKSRPEESGMSGTQRQWLQVSKVIANDPAPHTDYQGLSEEMSSWKYPLHFIDFETTMVAIPFNQGRRPYEQVAFQFSHHVVDKDGSIEHRHEYINRERGKFPNFDFVRALKAALSSDSGTIFRYAPHENTVLCQIREQLKASSESDSAELIAWIETITKSSEDSTTPWEGKRNMVDLWELVKRYYYHPDTQGSNSIKKVLPAILGTSEFLQTRYSKPVYGGPKGIKSKNFQDWQWIQRDEKGAIIDPYKLLQPIFSDLDLETMDKLITEGSLADGGAAMTAYARMQFTEMSEAERDRVTKALLRYCELDTFAMVLIFEYWQDLIGKSKSGHVAA